MKLPMRVMSACMASTCRSIMSRTCSSKESGIPAGCSIAAAWLGPRDTMARWMRFSMSRVASRYSSSLCRSCMPSWPERRAVSSITKSSMLGLLAQPREAALLVERIAVAEQPLEHVARIGRNGQRHGRVQPGNAIGISTAVTDVAAAEQAGRIDAKLQRTELRRLADMLGIDLVDRNAAADVRALGLPDMDPGEEGRAGNGHGPPAGRPSPPPADGRGR